MFISIRYQAWIEIKPLSAYRTTSPLNQAGAVSTGMIATSVPQRSTFHADHPFLYLITESSTGVILFAGKFGEIELLHPVPLGTLLFPLGFFLTSIRIARIYTRAGCLA